MKLKLLEIVNAKDKLQTDEDIRRIAEIMLHPKIMCWDIDYRNHGWNVETLVQKLKEFYKELPTNENQLWLLALIDGIVVGYLGIHRPSGYKSHVGDVGIMVHPDSQCKGVGTRLLKAGVELARQKGFKRLEADTLEENKAMRRIAEKTGFKLEGIREKSLDMHGELKDEALYAIMLDKKHK